MRRFLASTILAVFLLTGCHSTPQTNQQAAAKSDYKVYKLRGKILTSDPAAGVITVDGEAIPGYMDAMVMPYKLKDPSIVSDLHPGDVITADLEVYNKPSGDVLLDHFDVIAQGKPDYRPAMIYHVPAPGDVVPNFKMRNEDGRTIDLAQFRGKALLLTFIYTRCPLPNFCPLVTHNFALINKALSTMPAIYAKTHLLSISFDPEHDTPERLRAYGTDYILGNDVKDAFAHWDFATPAKTVVPEMARFFDVGITYGPDQSITHTLSTTLVGPDGKVVAFYPGNEWTTDEVLNDVKKLAGKMGWG